MARESRRPKKYGVDGDGICLMIWCKLNLYDAYCQKVFSVNFDPKGFSFLVDPLNIELKRADGDSVHCVNLIECLLTDHQA